MINLTVYVDVLIVLNILVNYFMLLGVRKITRSETKRLRVVLGAFIGGIASLLLFAESIGFLMTIIKMISAVLMCAVTFGVKPVKKLVKCCVWLIIICAVFGGITFLVYLVFDKDIMIYSNGIVYFDVNITFLIICSIISYTVITVITRLTDKKAPRQKEYYITLQGTDKTISCTALMDTGNNLREPFSDYPVIIADKSIYNDIFPDEEKIRLVPVSTVGGNTLMTAQRPVTLRIGSFSTDKVYVAKSLVPTDEYKIILNINLEGEIENVQN